MVQPGKIAKSAIPYRHATIHSLAFRRPCSGSERRRPKRASRLWGRPRSGSAVSLVHRSNPLRLSTTSGDSVDEPVARSMLRYVMGFTNREGLWPDAMLRRPPRADSGSGSGAHAKAGTAHRTPALRFAFRGHPKLPMNQGRAIHTDSDDQPMNARERDRQTIAIAGVPSHYWEWPGDRKDRAWCSCCTDSSTMAEPSGH